MGGNEKDIELDLREVFSLIIKRRWMIICIIAIAIIVGSIIAIISPEPERIFFNIAIAGVLGIVISFVSVVFLEYLNKTIITAKDIETYLQLKLIGTVPEYKPLSVVLESSDSFILECYNMIGTSIKVLLSKKQRKVIMLTSAGSGEGTSTTAANLAIALAKGGNSVILVDANLRKPALHKFFGIHGNEGIVDVIQGNTNYESKVVETKVDGLDLLLGGQIPLKPVQTLSSYNMKELINKLKDEYDYVIIDSPPAAIVADATIISSFVDAVLLVCASGEVTVDAAKRAKMLLDNVNANILGVVLNKITAYTPGFYFYKKSDYYRNQN